MPFEKLKKNKWCFAELQGEGGFVILFAVTISAILLSIALGVANIALKEVRFGTSAEDTNRAFFAADTGIECALLHDKNPTRFTLLNSNATLDCFGKSNIPTTFSGSSNTASYNFILNALAPMDTGCANVTVLKQKDVNSNINTNITARGYSVDDALCLPNPNRVERELTVSY